MWRLEGKVKVEGEGKVWRLEGKVEGDGEVWRLEGKGG